MRRRLDNNTRITLFGLAVMLACGAVIWFGTHALASMHQELDYQQATEDIAERRQIVNEDTWLEAASDPEATIDHTPWEGTVAVRVDEATVYQTVADFEKSTGLSLDSAEMLYQAETFGFNPMVITVDVSVRNDGAHTVGVGDDICVINAQDFPLAVDGSPCSLAYCGVIDSEGLNLNYSIKLNEGDVQQMSLVFAVPPEGSEEALGPVAQMCPPYGSESRLHLIVGKLVDNLEGSIADEYPFLIELHPQKAEN